MKAFARTAQLLILGLAAGLVLGLAYAAHLIAHHYGAFAALGAVAFVLLLPAMLTRPSHLLGVAATAARNTDTRAGMYVYLPLAADTIIFAGTLAARDADGRLVPAANTAGLRIIGRACETVDNRGGAAGALWLNVEPGIFKFANSEGQPITAADIGKQAVVEDDSTVAKTASNKVAAGRILDLESDGVWIDTRFAFFGPKTIPALTSTDGTAAGAAANLANLAAEAEKIGDDVRALHASLFD